MSLKNTDQLFLLVVPGPFGKGCVYVCCVCVWCDKRDVVGGGADQVCRLEFPASSSSQYLPPTPLPQPPVSCVLLWAEVSGEQWQGLCTGPA